MLQFCHAGSQYIEIFSSVDAEGGEPLRNMIKVEKLHKKEHGKFF